MTAHELANILLNCPDLEALADTLLIEEKQ